MAVSRAAFGELLTSDPAGFWDTEICLISQLLCVPIVRICHNPTHTLLALAASFS